MSFDTLNGKKNNYNDLPAYVNKKFSYLKKRNVITRKKENEMIRSSPLTTYVTRG